MSHELSPMTYKLFRYALCVFILILTLLSLYHLHVRLMAGINRLAGENYARDGLYGLAIERLKTAAEYQPADYEIQKEMGEDYYELGILKQTAGEAIALTLKSRDSYASAKRLNPLDAEAAYGAARAEFRLEQIYAYMHPGEENNPYNALPWYKEAVRLRPNSITSRYAMARYLAYHDNAELMPVVRDLSRVFPQNYYSLRREEFWSPEVRDEVKKGLEQAIGEGSSSKEAHKAMSALFEEEGKWTEALSHYSRALGYRTFENSSGDLIQLGYLNLKTGDQEAAKRGFITGLEMSMARDSDLARICGYYRAEDQWDEFSAFYGQLKRRRITTTNMDIVLAQALIDRKEYSQARTILMEVNKGEGNAEACYLLSRIAEKEEDWDSMELLMQKATLLAPRNSNYHLIFSSLLMRLKKLEGAEKEATLSLQYEARPSPWSYNHRASIRWAMKDYEGAAQDWRTAIGLNPDYAPFYAQAAEAYIQLAYWPIAMEYYRKALGLDPANEGYKKRYAELSSY